ncbi:MAG: Ribosomal silencing factor RsfS [Gammaproteobacteria bacterium]|nr:Ribosomal silencing factor RsfS [Gammaproteobacteria bacterium]
MDIVVLKNKLIDLLEEMKAEDVQTFNVKELTSVTDYMIVSSGTSNRHVRSIAAHVLTEMRAAGVRPLGSEGAEHGEWVLIDYGDIVLHVMQPRTRDFYQLEKLWNPDVKEMLRLYREGAND